MKDQVAMDTGLIIAVYLTHMEEALNSLKH